MPDKDKATEKTIPKTHLSIDFQLLNEVIEGLGRYKNNVQNRTNIQDFARFILSESRDKSLFEIGDPRPIEVEITIKLNYMVRFARLYSKQRPNDKELPIDEFTYLIPLLYKPEGMHKMHLVELNRQEKTTGIEIINRLIGKGMIEQLPDETDKRAKKLILSSKGKQILISHLGDFTALGFKVAEPLSQEEKETLLAILEKLFTWHNERL